MRIVVLNGSPKGKDSITLQYVSFLSKRFPSHHFEVVHIASKIKAIEKNEALFNSIIDEIKSADLVLWSFGVWVLGVSAQYMRFIELITELNASNAFKGKYTAAISTSIHYFDHTAHNYIRGVCEDLGARYLDAISLDIIDLKDKDKQRCLIDFAKDLFISVEKSMTVTRLTQPLIFSDFVYQPGPNAVPIANEGKTILVLTDATGKRDNLDKMIDRFKNRFPNKTHLVDLNDIDIKGACLGCMKCGYNYQCQYKDGFMDFYNHTVRKADIIMFAGEMTGRYLSSLWKTFFDRAFFWNHTPSLEGKQIAYLISGPISQNQNLVQILEASVTARQNANFVGIVSDESEDSDQIDGQIDHLAARLIQLATVDYVAPGNFLAVGGHKIFRDNIWGRLRGLWQADHRYYRKHGYYDFPQKKLGVRLIGPILILMTRIPKVRKAFYGNLKVIPARNLSKLIDKLT